LSHASLSPQRRRKATTAEEKEAKQRVKEFERVSCTESCEYVAVLYLGTFSELKLISCERWHVLGLSLVIKYVQNEKKRKREEDRILKALELEQSKHAKNAQKDVSRCEKQAVSCRTVPSFFMTADQPDVLWHFQDFAWACFNCNPIHFTGLCLHWHAQLYRLAHMMDHCPLQAHA
jgi:hypothetical protein